MKKILFTLTNLNIGGVQKTLINILNNLDLTAYEIDLLLLEKQSQLIKLLPKNINVIYINNHVQNTKASYIKRLEKNICIKKFLKKYKEISKKEYDIAIAFNGFDNNADLIVPMVKAKKKVIWVHNDFYNVIKNSTFPYIYFIMYKLMGRKFKYFDEIIIVCEEVAKNFNKLYKNKYQNKIKIINNLIDVDEIIEKGNEKSKFDLGSNFKIISTGRLCKAKNFELLIKMQYLLSKNGYKTKTFIIGAGKKEKSLNKKIKKLKLENMVILLGKQINPYSIMRQADLYVSTSYYESFANTILESLVLGVPVVATNTSGANNIAQNIVPKGYCSIASNEKELYTLITKKIKNRSKIKHLNLKNYNKKVMKDIEQILS